MTSRGSISFDHAAGFYDKTRALGPAAAARVTQVLERELRGRTTVLEVGVGTGRVALPLVARGIDVVGVDLSRKMLERLIANAGGAAPFPLVQGDATRIPLQNGVAGGAIVSWVLHLVPEWRDVLRELVRVTATDGVLLIDVGSEKRSITTRLTWRFREIAGVTDWPRGAKDPRQVEEVFAEMGIAGRSLEPIRDVAYLALEDHIAQLEQGIFSVTWGVDAQTRRRAADELREWAEEECGSITERLPIETTHVWHAFDL